MCLSQDMGKVRFEVGNSIVDSRLLKASACVPVDDKVYFVSSEVNLIYVLDLKTHLVNVLDSAPDENFFQENLYMDIVYLKGNLILVPYMAKKIWIYSLEQKMWKGIEIGTSVDYKFHAGVVYKERVYLLGHYYPGIVYVDIESGCVKQLEKVNEFLKRYGDQRGYFLYDYLLCDNILRVPMALSNGIISIDLDSGKYDYEPFPYKGCGLAGVVKNDEKIWFPPRKGRTYFIYEDKEYRRYELPEEFSNGTYYFCGGFVWKEDIFFAGRAGKCLKVSTKEPEKMEVIYQNVQCYKTFGDKVLVLFDDGKLYMAQDGYDIEPVEYCLENKDVLFDNLKKLYMKGISISGQVKETEFFSLEMFMESLEEQEA